MTFDPEDPAETEFDGDEELHWREEMTGERPILNPIGDPYHPNSL